jgi:hypothetical protein
LQKPALGSVGIFAHIIVFALIVQLGKVLAVSQHMWPYHLSEQA